MLLPFPPMPTVSPAAPVLARPEQPHGARSSNRDSDTGDRAVSVNILAEVKKLEHAHPE